MTTALILTRREALQGMMGAAVAAAVPTNAYSAIANKTESIIWPPGAPGLGRTQAFNDNWRFHLGGATGAESESFDDSTWRLLDVPHDWSIEDIPNSTDQTTEAIWTESANPLRNGPFDFYASDGQTATGWTVGGIGWYRKEFLRPALSRGGKVDLRFEGVYENCDVWLNGAHLGNHPYGYTEFGFDLTPHSKVGRNIVAVRVNNSGRNSRWYSGSGIFRKVWITVAEELRIPAHGVSITTPEVSTDAATIHAVVTVENGGNATKRSTLYMRLLDNDGAPSGVTFTPFVVAAGTTVSTRCELQILKPRLWSPKDASLYRAEFAIVSEGKVFDGVSLSIGIRKVEIDAVNGLRINNEPYKLRGGCVHNDNGPLGSVCIPRAEERRIEILKSNGFNAIRTSHNPPSRDFLEACDRLGMMVIDEAFDCWEEAKNPQDYHLYFKEWWERDLESLTVRDRNHPSVILWSIGNEVKERAGPHGVEIGKALAESAHRLDQTRKVTAGICEPYDHPKLTWQDMQPAFTYLDVAGYNYRLDQYENDHNKYPDRIIVGTESYPDKAFQNWSVIEKSSWVIGDFVWTAVDYIGEAGLGRSSLRPARAPSFGGGGLASFPWFNSYCGDIDLIGNKKPQSYFRDVVWRRSNIEMAVQRPIPSGLIERSSDWGWSDELQSWTWPGFEGAPLKVRVYTRGDRVKLLLNGTELESKQLTEQDALKAEFVVPYSVGELKAVAYQGQQEIGTKVLSTVGAARKLILTPDRTVLKPSRDDLSYVMVAVVDGNGRQLPDSVIPVSFAISGVGELAAVGSANPKDIASFQQPHCRTFHGQCIAVVRPKGNAGSIEIRVDSPGLDAATVTLKTSKAHSDS